MINSVLLLLAAQADLAISLDLRARPLSEVLEAISKSAQVSHTAAPAHAKEIMLIRFKDRPVSEVRRKIAWALDATWTQTDTGWTLARTAARTKEIENEARVSRKKEVEAFFAKVREKQKATPTTFTRIEAALKRSDSGNLDQDWMDGPAGYWLLQTWLDLGVDVVADTPSEGFAVYSDMPNKAQKPLPPVAHKNLRSLEEELFELGRESKQVAMQRDFARKSLKTIIKLFRTGASYRIGLVAYGAAGEEIYQVYQSSAYFGGSAYEKPDQLGKRAPAEFFDLNPLQKEYERVRDPQAEISRSSGPIKSATPSDQLLACLLNPERVDPLDYWNAEAVQRWAGDKGLCVVLPDRIDFASRYCLQPGRFHLGKFKQIAEPVGGLKTIAEPNWFLGRASNAPASERTRLDRAALGAFLRNSHDNKAETFEGYARYLWSAGKQAVYFGFWTTIQKTLWRFGVKPYTLLESHPYETWALIGSFGKSLTTLEAGHLLTYQQATPKQKVLMEALAYTSPYVDREDPKLRDLQLEPTEWAENDLAPAASFALVGAKDIALKRLKQTSDNFPMQGEEPPSSATELGKRFAWMTKLDLTNFGQVQLGTRSRILVQFRPARGILGEESFDLGFTNASKPFNSADLPAEFLTAAQQAWRAERAKANGGGR